MFGKLGDSFIGLLAVNRFGSGVSWFLVLVIVALWTCYSSLRTFSDLALVFFVISHVTFCFQICWTEDAALTQNRFPSKVICDQILLCHPCGVSMLKWFLHSFRWLVRSVLDVRIKRVADLSVDRSLFLCPFYCTIKLCPAQRRKYFAKIDKIHSVYFQNLFVLKIQAKLVSICEKHKCIHWFMAWSYFSYIVTHAFVFCF